MPDYKGNRQKVYDLLVKNGAYKGDFNSFDKAMEKPENREKVHSALAAHGAYKYDYEQFEKHMTAPAGGTPKSAGSPTPAGGVSTQPQAPGTVNNSSGNGGSAAKGAQQVQPASSAAGSGGKNAAEVQKQSTATAPAATGGVQQPVNPPVADAQNTAEAQPTGTAVQKPTLSTEPVLQPARKEYKPTAEQQADDERWQKAEAPILDAVKAAAEKANGVQTEDMAKAQKAQYDKILMQGWYDIEGKMMSPEEAAKDIVQRLNGDFGMAYGKDMEAKFAKMFRESPRYDQWSHETAENLVKVRQSLVDDYGMDENEVDKLSASEVMDVMKQKDFEAQRAQNPTAPITLTADYNPKGGYDTDAKPTYTWNDSKLLKNVYEKVKARLDKEALQAQEQVAATALTQNPSAAMYQGRKANAINSPAAIAAAMREELEAMKPRLQAEDAQWMQNLMAKDDGIGFDIPKRQQIHWEQLMSDVEPYANYTAASGMAEALEKTKGGFVLSGLMDSFPGEIASALSIDPSTRQAFDTAVQMAQQKQGTLAIGTRGFVSFVPDMFTSMKVGHWAAEGVKGMVYGGMKKGLAGWLVKGGAKSAVASRYAEVVMNTFLQDSPLLYQMGEGYLTTGVNFAVFSGLNSAARQVATQGYINGADLGKETWQGSFGGGVVPMVGMSNPILSRIVNNNLLRAGENITRGTAWKNFLIQNGGATAAFGLGEEMNAMIHGSEESRAERWGNALAYTVVPALFHKQNLGLFSKKFAKAALAPMAKNLREQRIINDSEGVQLIRSLDINMSQLEVEQTVRRAADLIQKDKKLTYVQKRDLAKQFAVGENDPILKVLEKEQPEPASYKIQYDGQQPYFEVYDKDGGVIDRLYAGEPGYAENTMNYSIAVGGRNMDNLQKGCTVLAVQDAEQYFKEKRKEFTGGLPKNRQSTAAKRNVAHVREIIDKFFANEIDPAKLKAEDIEVYNTLVEMYNARFEEAIMGAEGNMPLYLHDVGMIEAKALQREGGVAANLERIKNERNPEEYVTVTTASGTERKVKNVPGIEELTEQEKQSVHDDGSFHPAELTSGEKVFIIKGNVVGDEYDGRPDEMQSDKIVYYVGEDGMEHAVHISKVKSIDEPMSVMDVVTEQMSEEMSMAESAYAPADNVGERDASGSETLTPTKYKAGETYNGKRNGVNGIWRIDDVEDYGEYRTYTVTFVDKETGKELETDYGISEEALENVIRGKAETPSTEGAEAGETAEGAGAPTEIGGEGAASAAEGTRRGALKGYKDLEDGAEYEAQGTFSDGSEWMGRVSIDRINEDGTYNVTIFDDADRSEHPIENLTKDQVMGFLTDEARESMEEYEEAPAEDGGSKLGAEGTQAEGEGAEAAGGVGTPAEETPFENPDAEKLEGVNGRKQVKKAFRRMMEADTPEKKLAEYDRLQGVLEWAPDAITDAEKAYMEQTAEELKPILEQRQQTNNYIEQQRAAIMQRKAEQEAAANAQTQSLMERQRAEERQRKVAQERQRLMGQQNAAQQEAIRAEQQRIAEEQRRQEEAERMKNDPAYHYQQLLERRDGNEAAVKSDVEHTISNQTEQRKKLESKRKELEKKINAPIDLTEDTEKAYDNINKWKQQLADVNAQIAEKDANIERYQAVKLHYQDIERERNAESIRKYEEARAAAKAKEAAERKAAEEAMAKRQAEEAAKRKKAMEEHEKKMLLPEGLGKPRDPHEEANLIYKGVDNAIKYLNTRFNLWGAKEYIREHIDNAHNDAVKDFWKQVEAEQERITTPRYADEEEAIGTDKPATNEEMTTALVEGTLSPKAAAAYVLMGGDLDRATFMSETGTTAADFAGFVGMFKKNGGKSLSSVAHSLWENHKNIFENDQDARNAIIDAITSARTKGELRKMVSDEVVTMREGNTAERMWEEQARREYLAEQMHHDSYEDYLAEEENAIPEIIRRMADVDEKELDRFMAEENEKAGERAAEIGNNVEPKQTDNGKDNNGTGEGGNSVLPKEQPSDRAGEEAVQGEGTRGEMPIQDGEVPGELKPVGVGSFGSIFNQFKGKAKEAIAFLLERQEGEAIGALHHSEIGDIDLVWGKEGTGMSDGYGLAKLAKYHPEVLDNLQEILDDMHVTNRSENRVQLESDTHQAAVRLKWDNQKKNWLLTAFEKKNSALDNTTDTDKTTDSGKRNDTATPQSTVSVGKGTTISENGKENGGKVTEAVEKTSGEAAESVGTPAEDVDIADTDAVQKHLDSELGKSIGAHATLVYDVNDIPSEERGAVYAISDGKTVRGWYNPETGKAYVYMPSIDSAERFEKCLLHEVVGHKGLRELLGDGFSKVCQDAYRGMEQKDRIEYMKYAWNTLSKQTRDSIVSGARDKRFDQLTHKEKVQVFLSEFMRQRAADEYMAHFAGTGVTEKTRIIWDRICAGVRDLLRKAGFNISFNDSDIAALLYQSKRKLESESPMERAKAIVTIEDLKKPEVAERMGFGGALFSRPFGKNKPYRLNRTYHNAIPDILKAVMEKKYDAPGTDFVKIGNFAYVIDHSSDKVLHENLAEGGDGFGIRRRIDITNFTADNYKELQRLITRNETQRDAIINDVISSLQLRRGANRGDMLSAGGRQSETGHDGMVDDAQRREIELSGHSFESVADRRDETGEDYGDVNFSLVDDPDVKARLDKEETVKVYRAMQLIDGKLYPPMSAMVDGKLREPSELGKWEQADEHPEKADNNGKFKLDKGNKKSLKAAYNPYIHTSPTPLNDQFSEAQSRPNLVTVEVEVPKSELTSGYKAEKAKDAVGQVEWKAGIIQGQLSGTRTVILSRWDKPVRVVPDSEVADVIVGMFGGKEITMPSNVVTPSLRAELEKRGVPFVETNNQGKLVEGENAGVHYSKVYGAKAKQRAEIGEEGLLFRDGVMGGQPMFREPAEADFRSGQTLRLHRGEYRGLPSEGTDGWRYDGQAEVYKTKERALDALRNDNPEIAFIENGDGTVTTTPWRELLKPKKLNKAGREYMQREIRRAEEAVKELGEKLGISDKFNVLYTTDGLKGRMAKAKGWFNPATGEITIVMPNNRSRADVVKTVLHEGVAHYGLRKMFGEDFDTFLDNVYNNVEDHIREMIDEIAEREGDTRKATEEFLGKLAENSELERDRNASWLSRVGRVITEQFMKMLRKVGARFGIKLNDKDLRYILWRSWRNMAEETELRNSNPAEVAKDVMMREKLGIGKVADGSAEIGEDKKANPSDVQKYDEENGTEFGRFVSFVDGNRILKDGEKNYFHIGNTGTLLNKYGLKGKITIKTSTVNANRHSNKDIVVGTNDWLNVINGINEPLAITKTKDRQRRLYLDVEIDGQKVCVVVDAHETGRNTEVSNIRTLFPRDLQKILTSTREELLYPNEEKLKRAISLSSQAHNEQASDQSLVSGGKGKENISSVQGNGENLSILRENNDAEYLPGIRFRDGDDEPAKPKTYAERMSEARAHALASIGKLTGKVFDKRGSDPEKLKQSMDNQEAGRKAVKDFINIGLDSKNMSQVGKAKLSRIMKLVENVKSPAALRAHFVQAERIIQDTEIGRLKEQMDRMLTMKKRGVNSRNVSIAQSVDERTRLIFETLRKEGEVSQREREDILRRWKDQLTSLEADYNDGNARFTDEMYDRLEALTIMKAMNDGDAMEDTKIDGNDCIADLKAKQAELIAKNKQLRVDRHAADERDKPLITREINANSDQIDNLDTEINAIKEQQIAKYREAQELMAGVIGEGRERLKEQKQAERDRRSEIAQLAYYDIKTGKKWRQYDRKGRLIDTEHRGNTAEHIHTTFVAGLESFVYMTQKVSNRLSGTGYLYRRFVEGDGGVVAAHSNHVAAQKRAKSMMDDAAVRFCGEGTLMERNARRGLDGKVTNEGRLEQVERELMSMADKNCLDVTVTEKTMVDGMEIVHETSHKLNKGNMMYLSQLWNMTDGQMKLKAMGFTEEHIQEMRAFLGDDLNAFSDWMVNEYYPQLRERMNAKHKEIYFTSMAEVENYVPIHIDRQAIKNDSNLVEGEMNDYSKNLQKRNGSLVNRTVNTLPIDLSRTAIGVLAEHTNTNEEWIAYARVRQDLDYLLSSKAFKNQMNANSHGSYKDFVEATQVAALLPAENTTAMDNLMNAVSAGVISGAIAYRPNTALKQFLSFPAFYGYSQSPKYMLGLTKRFFTAVPNYKWAMENLPSFRKRVEGGLAGDSDMENGLNALGDNWFNRFTKKYALKGMIPNKLVDAVTCAAGARAIYEYEFSRMKKRGYDEEAAHNYALRQADIAYNETQQSNVAAFKSAMQTTARSWTSRMFTVYQNSNMGYTRKGVLATADLWKGLKNHKALVSKYAEDFGVSESEASAAINNKLRKSAVLVGLMQYGIKILWDSGNEIMSNIFFGGWGDDDDKYEEEEETDSTVKTMQYLSMAAGYFLQGTAGGNILHDVATSGKYNPFGILFESEASKIAEVYEKYKISPELAAQILVSGMSLRGFKVETWANVYLALEDMVVNGFDQNLAMDVALILNMPKSTRDHIARTRKDQFDPMEYAKAMSFARKYMDRNAVTDLVLGTKDITDKKFNDLIDEWQRSNVGKEVFAEFQKDKKQGGLFDEIKRYHQKKGDNMMTEEEKAQFKKEHPELTDEHVNARYSEKINDLRKAYDDLGKLIKAHRAAGNDAEFDKYVKMRGDIITTIDKLKNIETVSDTEVKDITRAVKNDVKAFNKAAKKAKKKEISTEDDE